MAMCFEVLGQLLNDGHGRVTGFGLRLFDSSGAPCCTLNVLLAVSQVFPF